jgi:hypothetical protein
VGLGTDRRYLYPVVEQVSVDSATTSVQVFQQSSRTLASAANVVRSLGATSTKPEVASAGTLLTVPLKQLAAIESGVPNLYLEQGGFTSLIESDLRLSLNDGVDKLCTDALSTAGTIAKGASDIFTVTRKAITSITNAGYAPNYLVIDAAGAEALDLFTQTPASGGTLYSWGAPGQYAPGSVFGLGVRITKNSGTAVVDSRNFGRLYLSPLTLSRFEENAGQTNTSTVRLEGSGAYGVERLTAALRIT